ncbi:MAG: DegT/DnrJ/EryC1/StrS family aminotransferase [Spirochaetes bacterium]|nr:DegT/DnrJ/EryC1/StrS family aminotransferase [Spirochaetota bacterium]
MSKLALNGGPKIKLDSWPEWPVYNEKEKNMLMEVLESRQWGTLGPKVLKLNEKFASFIHAGHALSVSSGTSALEVVLRALGIGYGDEVIVPPYTFMATVTSVLMVNATPVFVDIDPDSNCIDSEKIEDAVTSRTRAIIPVHISGTPADMDEIMKIAGKHNLTVIEDAAQAHGSEWKGRKVGSIGTAAIFSFQLSKNITSGEGGMITTNNKELADLCWSVHHVGRSRNGEWYRHYRLSGNYRMTEWQAAVLLAQLERLEAQGNIRERNFRILNDSLDSIEGVETFKIDPRVTRHSHHLYMFKYKREHFNNAPKTRFIEALNAEGIPSGYGYIEIHQQPLFKTPEVKKILTRDINYESLELPETKRACSETVWIPQNALLAPEKDMENIAGAILKIRENRNEL